jgi:mono/diheme cytochrome c family protein
MLRFAPILLALFAQSAWAMPGIKAAMIDSYRVEAKQEDPAFSGFSAQRGEQFFRAKHGEMSCASCHTDNPKQAGSHVKTGKAIEPLAPVANPQRLSDPAKVEKWFKRNCNEVLQRACTAREKGDFMTWLRGLQ